MGLFRFLFGKIPVDIDHKVDSKELEAIKQLIEEFKKLAEGLKEHGILGPGFNSFANEVALSVEGVRKLFEGFFEQIVKICVPLWQKAAVIGSAAFARAAQFAKGPAFPYVVGGIVIVGVGTVGYFVWKRHKRNQEIKRRQEAIHGLERKVQELSKQRKKLRRYLTEGEFVRELFAIAGITRSEIEGAKEKVNYYLRCLSEYGYGDVSSLLPA